jgi:LacI family transcriptional regulator
MASLKCIASELGVSYTLVSKVLSGRLGTTGVSPKTREAILRKAKQLDYVPNPLAVALKAGRKGAVGIFLHHIGSPGSDVSDSLLKGVAEGLEQSSSRMWLRFFTTDEDFLTACDTRLKQEVDGLIVAGVSHPRLMRKFRDLEREQVPVVGVFNDLPESARQTLTVVAIDYEKQGYLAARHLLEQGCRSLACLRTIENRTAGFVRAHREAGIKPNPRLILSSETFFADCGRTAVARLVESGIRFDGLVCQSDSQALGAINEFVRRGIRVPEDVKVTGVDNSPLAEACIVPITSVTSEMRTAGRKAVETLREKIEGRSVSPAAIEPSLVLRRSSGADS